MKEAHSPQISNIIYRPLLIPNSDWLKKHLENIRLRASNFGLHLNSGLIFPSYSDPFLLVWS